MNYINKETEQLSIRQDKDYNPTNQSDSIQTYHEDDLTYKPLTVDFPTGLYKSVMHTPQEDEDQYMELVRKRYKSQMYKFLPKALYKALTVKNINQVSDKEFNHFFWVCSFGKWLRWGNEKDVAKWQEHIDLDWSKMVIGNYEGMNELTAYEGMYSMGGDCVFERKGDKLEVRAIELNGVFYFPKDGQAWEVAKVFTIYGAYNHVLLLHHPRVHFQLNPFAGHTYRILPENHIVRQLLQQHFKLSLEINRAVLHSPFSAIGDNLKLPYTSFATKREETFKIISQGFDGIEGNDSYEPFEFELEIPDYCTDYSTFLQAYYDVILKFVEQVLAEVDFKKDRLLAQWAQAIANDLPGFEAEFIENNLAKVLTKVIHNASVEHSTEHGALGKIPVDKVFLRMRVPTPSTKEEASKINLKKMRSRKDYFKHLMTWKMYVNPNNVFLLKDVDYGFEAPSLQKLTQEFKQDLANVEKGLKARGVHIYDDFKNMACSIQY